MLLEIASIVVDSSISILLCADDDDIEVQILVREEQKNTQKNDMYMVRIDNLLSLYREEASSDNSLNIIYFEINTYSNIFQPTCKLLIVSSFCFSSLNKKK